MLISRFSVVKVSTCEPLNFLLLIKMKVNHDISNRFTLLSGHLNVWNDLLLIGHWYAVAFILSSFVNKTNIYSWYQQPSIPVFLFYLTTTFLLNSAVVNVLFFSLGEQMCSSLSNIKQLPEHRDHKSKVITYFDIKHWTQFHWNDSCPPL